MKKFRITKYLEKTYSFYISKYYKLFLRKKYLIELTYFYWLYNKLYIRNIKGLAVSVKLKRYNNMISFCLYYKYKNVDINQLYFISSPFNLFFKYKLSNIKRYRLYIL